MQDLSVLDTVSACDAGADVEIRNPKTGVGMGIFFRVFGRDSSAFKAESRRLSNARIRKEALASRRGREEIRTSEEIEKDNLDLLVACTQGWYTLVSDEDGVVTRKESVRLGDEVFSFSPENARRLYQKFPPLFEQVNDAIGALDNFLK